MSSTLNRRDLLKLVSAATLAAPLALPAADPGSPLFFTKEEFALLDTLSELIIPADNHSPGAQAAGVAAYIDKTVAEAFLAKDKDSWRNGLAEVNRLSKSLHDTAFLALPKEKQVAVLKKLADAESSHESRNENEPENQRQEEPQKFFGQLKNTTVFAYYSSSIGIHQEMNYKGNVLLKEFVGYMPDAELPPISSLSSAT